MLPLVIILGALFCFGGVYAWLRRPIDDLDEAAAALPAALERAERLGLAVYPSQLHRSPPIPADENAAPLYRDAVQLWAQAVEDPDRLTRLSRLVVAGRDDREQLAEFRALLARLQTPLALMEEASWKPYCDFERPFEQGASLELTTELRPLRQAAGVLAAKAILEAEVDLANGLQTLGTAARIGGHVQEDPTLLCMIVACAIDTIVHVAAYRLAVLRYDSLEDLAQIERVLSDVPPLPSPQHSHQAELVIGMSTMKNPEQLAESAAQAGMKIRLSATDTACRAYQCRLLELWCGVAEASAKLPDELEFAALMRQVPRQVHQRRELSYAPLRLYGQAFGRGVEAVVRRIADRTLVRCAVQLLQHWNQHGWLPLTLEGHPRDPFTGEPIRYERSSTGFRLESSGGVRDQAEVIGKKIITSGPIVKQFFFPQT